MQRFERQAWWHLVWLVQRNSLADPRIQLVLHLNAVHIKRRGWVSNERSFLCQTYQETVESGLHSQCNFFLFLPCKLREIPLTFIFPKFRAFTNLFLQTLIQFIFSVLLPHCRARKHGNVSKIYFRRQAAAGANEGWKSIFYENIFLKIKDYFVQ